MYSLYFKAAFSFAFRISMCGSCMCTGIYTIWHLEAVLLKEIVFCYSSQKELM